MKHSPTIIITINAKNIIIFYLEVYMLSNSSSSFYIPHIYLKDILETILKKGKIKY